MRGKSGSGGYGGGRSAYVSLNNKSGLGGPSVHDLNRFADDAVYADIVLTLREISRSNWRRAAKLIRKHAFIGSYIQK